MAGGDWEGEVAVEGRMEGFGSRDRTYTWRRAGWKDSKNEL